CDVWPLPFEPERRRACGNMQALDLGQPDDDLLRDAVTEVILIWFRAEVCERDHRNRRSNRRRLIARRMTRRLARRGPAGRGGRRNRLERLERRERFAGVLVSVNRILRQATLGHHVEGEPVLWGWLGRRVAHDRGRQLERGS